MKVWWVTVWDDFYPDGGLNNVHNTYETEAEAKAAADVLRDIRWPWAGGTPRHGNVEIEDVSRRLGLTTE